MDIVSPLFCPSVLRGKGSAKGYVHAGERIRCFKYHYGNSLGWNGETRTDEERRLAGQQEWWSNGDDSRQSSELKRYRQIQQIQRRQNVGLEEEVQEREHLRMSWATGVESTAMRTTGNRAGGARRSLVSVIICKTFRLVESWFPGHDVQKFRIGRWWVMVQTKAMRTENVIWRNRKKKRRA